MIMNLSCATCLITILILLTGRGSAMPSDTGLIDGDMGIPDSGEANDPRSGNKMGMDNFPVVASGDPGDYMLYFK